MSFAHFCYDDDGDVHRNIQKYTHMHTHQQKNKRKKRRKERKRMKLADDSSIRAFSIRSVCSMMWMVNMRLTFNRWRQMADRYALSIENTNEINSKV